MLPNGVSAGETAWPTGVRLHQRVLFEPSANPRAKGLFAYELGVIHAALGDEDQAFKWLALAVQERSGWIAYLRVDPRLDKLHTDARFTELTPTRAAGS